MPSGENSHIYIGLAALALGIAKEHFPLAGVGAMFIALPFLQRQGLFVH